MDIAAWIADYGYIAVACAAFLEGEAALLAGSLAVHMGLLSLPWVLVSAAAGALLVDHTFFLMGRMGGRRLSAHRRLKAIHGLIERHHIPVMLGFRFLYGARALTLMALGTSALTAPRFLMLDILAVALWTAVVGTACYFLGGAVAALFPKARLLLLLALAALALALFLRARPGATTTPIPGAHKGPSPGGASPDACGDTATPRPSPLRKP
ncbi:MAG: DedA family protein [Gammaproteobacteria bacterium]|nr:MAG: DedA family protein [Gammaproteobacteria bacterium]